MGTVFYSLAEALAAAVGTEFEVVKLAPLARYILVTRWELAVLASPFGWERVA